VTSRTTERFRDALERLPAHVRRRARHAYQLFRDDPFHPSLQFKRVHPTLPIFSARIGLGYRALATVDGDTVVWFWVGTHAHYDRLLGKL
jgi:mRNA-degrading endonuclease RelE of RelBE toxin-antitoxin system